MAVLYRSICRDFFSDADVVELSPTARLLYLATWLEADREGRLPWDIRTLSVRYFPRDQIDLSVVANELMRLGLVVPYFAQDRSLAWLPKFKQFQSFNNREAPSKLPDPHNLACARGDATAREETGDNAHDVMKCNVSHAGTCAPNPSHDKAGSDLIGIQKAGPAQNLSYGGDDEF